MMVKHNAHPREEVPYRSLRVEKRAFVNKKGVLQSSAEKDGLRSAFADPNIPYVSHPAGTEEVVIVEIDR